MRSYTRNRVIVYSLIGSIVFGLVDAIFFLALESDMQEWLLSINYIDHMMAPLIICGISSGISIFICNTLNHILKTRYKIELRESAAMDVFGILFGTSIVILVYYLFMTHRFKKHREKDEHDSL